MELQLTKVAFKKQAQKQHAALRARHLDIKLSDLQESLAIAYGFQNLATLYAKFKSEELSEVDAKPYAAQTSNLFVLTWFCPEDGDDVSLEEVLGVYPPGTELNQLNARDFSNWSNVERLNESVTALPEGFELSAETVVLENYAYLPDIAKYGLDDAADERLVNTWVKDYLGFRVPRDGVEVCVHETGDDGGSKYHFLVWLNDSDSAKMRSLFVQN